MLNVDTLIASALSKEKREEASKEAFFFIQILKERKHAE